MKCYICGEEIKEEEAYFYIGKQKNGEKLYRHDDDEHTEHIIRNFKRSVALGEQIG